MTGLSSHNLSMLPASATLTETFFSHSRNRKGAEQHIKKKVGREIELPDRATFWPELKTSRGKAERRHGKEKQPRRGRGTAHTHTHAQGRERDREWERDKAQRPLPAAAVIFDLSSSRTQHVKYTR
ncbi:hypothetical protein LX32DRAFT_407219 [Colletotrichum zoysiae]|uniref:Uncharacterized protein n=1 Tax=Colletotrichum zoysiae TaxID=1216348 RepID=A0AAD9HHL6_9PEZI|nr:hypothetical protein LX32DRAFT_407219 [Colletotrichum zoysiae]